MKRAFIFLILIICVNSIYCQDILIKGKIVDDKLSELLAVNVKNIESNRHALTNENGLFEIESNLGDTLEISFVGFTTERIIVSDTGNIKLIMTDKSVNCLGAIWSKRDYKKANKRIEKKLKALYKQADKNQIWQDLK
jgi:hypothetical protein